MKLRRRITAIALVLALPLVGAGSCDKREDGTTPSHADPTKDSRPGCPDIDFRADYERCFSMQTFVESRLGPYDVYLKIEGGVGAYPAHIPVAAGGWKHSIVYHTGSKLTVTLKLTYEGAPSSDGFCSITDGAQSTGSIRLKSIRAQGGSPYEAVCTLTTHQ